VNHSTERRTVLKRDLFGEVTQIDSPAAIWRDVSAAPWWTRPLARWLMRREARALAAVSDLGDVPVLMSVDRNTLTRSFLDGAPMQSARPRDPAFYSRARRLLIRLHRTGVTHNDLAKEPNILVQANGEPAFIDFQLAIVFRRRGRLFRLLAREDLRHLLKHKRTYCPDALTARERGILATPSVLSRVWMATAKPVYMFVTRRLLGWADREGAGDRGSVR